MKPKVNDNNFSYLCHSRAWSFKDNGRLPEGECREWSVRLVAVHVAHGRAPEVIPKHLANGAESQHVLVLCDRRNVVVNEVPGQTVKVAAERHDAHDAVHPAAATVADLSFSRPCRTHEGRLGEPTWWPTAARTTSWRYWLPGEPHGSI